MTASIFRLGKPSTWEGHGTRFFKMPGTRDVAGKSEDGFYLFNKLTVARPYIVCGSVSEVIDWFYIQQKDHGFFNDTLQSHEDVYGQKFEDTEGYDSAHGTGAKPGGYLSPADRPVTLTGVTGGIQFGGIKIHEAAKIDKVRYDPLAKKPPKAALVRPSSVQESLKNVKRSIFMRTALLLETDAAQIQSLNPVGDVVTQLAMGASGMVPGGGANEVAEMIVDGMSAAYDGASEVRELLKNGGNKQGQNLMACIEISVAAQGTVHTFDADDNSGRVTFGDITRSSQFATLRRELESKARDK